MRKLKISYFVLILSGSIALQFAMSAIRSTSAISAASPADKTPSSSNAELGSYKLNYGKDGDLTPPIQYRDWVFLSSGLDMSYNPVHNPEMSMFSNIFVNPEAYRIFLESRHWPDKTVMVLESRAAQSKGSINKSGHYQSGGVMGFELHVKDEKRFPGEWGFFDVVSESKATLIPQGAPCYSCHADRAAVDTTFVQFYPTLLPVAKQKCTLSGSFLHEKAALERK